MGERQSVEQTEANPERSDEPPQLSLSVVRDEFRASASMAQKGFKGESSAVVSRAVADPKSSVSVKNIDTQVEVFDKNESVKKTEKKTEKRKEKKKKKESSTTSSSESAAASQGASGTPTATSSNAQEVKKAIKPTDVEKTE